MDVEIIKCLAAKMGHVINKLLLFLGHYSMRYQLVYSRSFRATYTQNKKIDFGNLIQNIGYIDCINYFISLAYDPSKTIGLWNYKQLTIQSIVEVYCDEFDCIIVSNPIQQRVFIDFRVRIDDFFNVYLFALLNLDFIVDMLTVDLYNGDLNCLDLIGVFRSTKRVLIISTIYQCDDDSIVMFTTVNDTKQYPVHFPLLKDIDIARLVFDEIVRQLQTEDEEEESEDE